MTKFSKELLDENNWFVKSKNGLKKFGFQQYIVIMGRYPLDTNDLSALIQRAGILLQPWDRLGRRNLGNSKHQFWISRITEHKWSQFRYSETAGVLSAICDLLKSAIKDNKRVWIDKD